MLGHLIPKFRYLSLKLTDSAIKLDFGDFISRKLSIFHIFLKPPESGIDIKPEEMKLDIRQVSNPQYLGNVGDKKWSSFFNLSIHYPHFAPEITKSGRF